MSVRSFFARFTRGFGEDDPAAAGGPSRPPTLGGWIRWSPLLGVGAVVAYAIARDSSEAPLLSLLAVGLVIFAAASAVGALVGFLFGLPRTLPVATPAGDLQAPAPGAMATNTNLEEISDWLTKILVGIGLVQLGALVTRLSELGDSLAPALGGAEGADSFATALVVYCLVDGFLLGYLWTRIVVSVRLLYIQRILQATDAALARDPTPPPSPAPPPPALAGGNGGTLPVEPPQGAAAGAPNGQDEIG